MILSAEFKDYYQVDFGSYNRIVYKFRATFVDLRKYISLLKSVLMEFLPPKLLTIIPKIVFDVAKALPNIIPRTTNIPLVFEVKEKKIQVLDPTFSIRNAILYTPQYPKEISLTDIIYRQREFLYHTGELYRRSIEILGIRGKNEVKWKRLGKFDTLLVTQLQI